MEFVSAAFIVRFLLLNSRTELNSNIAMTNQTKQVFGYYFLPRNIKQKHGNEGEL